MKQKLVVLLLLVFLASLGIVAYRVYTQQHAELAQLQRDMQLGHKQLTELNDRVAALSRQQAGPLNIPGLLGSSQPANAVSALNAAQQLQLEFQRTEVRQLKLQWLQANVQLAQDATLQARFDQALLLLQETQRHIIQADDSQTDPLDLALLQSLKNDQQQIRQSSQQYRQVQLALDRSLSAIQQQLLQDGSVKLSSKKTGMDGQESGFKSWFRGILVVEKISPETRQLALDRGFVYKQTIMLASLARQAVAENDQASLNAYLQDMLNALQPLADAQSKAIRSNIASLQQQHLPSAGQLTSLALLSRQKGVS